MPFHTTEDGVKLYYEVWGEGDTAVVMEQGVFSSIESGLWMRPFAEEGLSVVVYEKRGTGRSDRLPPTPENYSGDLLFQDSLSLTDGLGVEKIIPVGWFDGATRTVRRAVERPDETIAIVLCGPALGGVDVSEDFDQAFRALAGAGFNYVLPAFVEAGNPDADSEQKKLAAQMMHDNTTSEIAIAMWSASQQEGRSFPLEETLARVSCPALVLAGTADIVVPLDYVRRVAAKLPASQMAEFEGAGNGMWFTRTEETLSAIREFLATLDPPLLTAGQVDSRS